MKNVYVPRSLRRWKLFGVLGKGYWITILLEVWVPRWYSGNVNIKDWMYGLLVLEFNPS